MCRAMADAAVGRWLSAVSFWEGQAVRRIFQRWRRLSLLKLATAEQHTGIVPAWQPPSGQPEHCSLPLSYTLTR